MTISLNVLKHLGIGLYSNIPAVLSEVVANAWDADAKKVTIDIDPDNDEIVIYDNGCGMSRNDINGKYLVVGYDKRGKEPGKTKELDRLPMGRKGIGKLSVFSIAETIEVHSAKPDVKMGDLEISGVRMSRSKIKEQIELASSKNNEPGESGIYTPEDIGSAQLRQEKGTTIILRGIDKSLSKTETFLRKRLARRFSVIGAMNQFEVIINGEPINPKDRDFFGSLEFLWYIGDESEYIAQECEGLAKPATKVVDEIVLDDGTKYKLKGWVGTVDERKSLDDDDNVIVVLAHGKLVQEDILKDLKEGGVFSKYIIGDIEADFLDLDVQEDIITSDRQKLKVDDPRYQKLRLFVKQLVTKVGNDWVDFRNEIGEKKALENPVIKEWYERLKGDNQKAAKKLFAKIETFKGVTPETKHELYKASLLAFEKLALKNSLSALDSLQNEQDFFVLKALFDSIDEVEAVHYYQIAKARLR